MMNPPRSNYLEYQIVRLRLVNFHNFVNETVDIRQGGHLFLVGPNGSGKSTVIDAVHVVLSGAHELELNAAARMGGRKDEGRTLQGVVLRYDRELGALNEGGGISYAAIELAAINNDKRLSLGIGIEATTMEARLSRWGFIVKNCGVEDLPLLIGELQGQRPATREELEDRIGKGNVYARMSQFRKKIAEEFFASESLYEQVAHLWNTGKAYREICARAGDFQTLFMTLLPEPDIEIFSEIINSLIRIQEFAGKLEQLAEQLRYLERLMALQEKIANAREEEARYDWLISYRESSFCKTRLAETQKQLAHALAEAEKVESALKQFHSEHDQLKKMLAELRHKDEARLLERLQLKQEALNRHAKFLQQQHAQVRAYEERLRRAQQELAKRRADLIAEIELAQNAVSQALQNLLTTPLPAAIPTFVNDFVQTAPTALVERGARPQANAALQETTELLAQLAQERLRLQHDLERREDLKKKIQQEIDNLQRQREWLPQLPNYHQCLQRLEAEGLAPQPLYKMLEWRTEDADLRSAIEELLGQQLLGTLVLNDGEADRLKTTVLQDFPGIAVAETSSEEADCPDWIAAALDDRTNGMALRLIGAALTARHSQEAEYEQVKQQLAWRGLRWKAEGKPARLIGAEARRLAFAQEMAQRRAELAEQENHILALQEQLQRNFASTQQWRDLEEGLRQIGGEAISGAFRAHEAATVQASALQNSRDEWARSYVLAGEESEALSAEIQQLEQRIAAAGLQGLARQIEDMEKCERTLEEKIRLAAEERGRWRHETARLESEALGQNAQLAQTEATLQAKALRLRQYVSEQAEPDLEYYVLSTRGGDRFKSDEAIARRKEEAHDALNVALTKLQDTGEEGIHYRQYAGIFGFGYLPEENKIIDRQHQPLQGVHHRLQQDYADQQDILNEKNKELLDQLIMESLSRHLTEQVVQQKKMIKDINRLLREIDFGGTIYAFEAPPKPEHREVVEIVENFSLLDENRRQNFRAFIESRLLDLRESEPGTVPPLLDYRTWFDYKLTFRDTKSEATELTRRMRNLGSGGEQAVPNYLLVLAMSHLVFQNSRGRLRPMLFDEAFYGIDAGRRDRLLEFATRLGMQLFVASPDQDGHTNAVRHATTVFVQKDENRDVHLTALHSDFGRDGKIQEDLFMEAATEEIKAKPLGAKQLS
jgi:energy-coupling factor transporter ATP-binding protein EcfA2